MPKVPDAQAHMMAFLRRSLARIQPAFGMAFFRKRRHGPEYYALGATLRVGSLHSLTGPAYEAGRAVSRWRCRDFDAIDAGALRDIGTYHIIGEQHLAHPVASGTLRQYIEADTSRGHLEPLGHGYTLWTVPEESQQTVRVELAPSGLLYVWRREDPQLVAGA